MSRDHSEAGSGGSGDDEPEESGFAPHSRPAAAVASTRLLFRAPVLADVDQIALNANDVAVAAPLRGVPYPYTRADAEAWVEICQKQTRGFQWVAIDHATNTLVGSVGITPRDDCTDLMLGYWIGARHAGRGYATEAAQAAIDHAFTALDVDAIGAYAQVTNFASRRILEKCAFQWVGHGMERSQFRGGMASVDRFRLDRGIWSAIKAWGRGEAPIVRPQPGPGGSDRMTG